MSTFDLWVLANAMSGLAWAYAGIVYLVIYRAHTASWPRLY